MNKPLVRLLSVAGLLVLGALLFVSGTVFAQSRWLADSWPAGWMAWGNNPSQAGRLMARPHMNGAGAPGAMMAGGMMGSETTSGAMMAEGMMNGTMMDHMMAEGMIAGATMGQMMGGDPAAGGFFAGMMGAQRGQAAVEPLTIAAAEGALEAYLADLNNPNLRLGEIMIFDNHAYAQIVEAATGQGAFEVLVDPVSGRVFPEPGPNMMWNTSYGMMAAGHGMMAVDRPGGGGAAGEATTAAGAVDRAQAYLDARWPGTQADSHAVAFPGYYTLHILEDGALVGMLSVNAASGQVFFHHWHGDFITMSGPDHD